jgi:hypothetical protein
MDLIKTLRIDDDVLEVLKNDVIWAEEENGDWIAYMPQLSPDLYRKVKKVFQHPELDGTWVKRRDGTVFPKDPRPMLFRVQESGTMTVARDGFFRTPTAVVEKILSLMAVNPMDDTKTWLEPECGDGAIIYGLKCVAHENQITAVEKNPDRCRIVAERYPGVSLHNDDFMVWKPQSSFDYILMNPPFEKGQGEEHTRRAYTFLKRGGKMASILGEGTFFQENERTKTFRAWLKAVGAYTEELPTGSFKSSGTMVDTHFILVEKV